jgi:hypothetical protein
MWVARTGIGFALIAMLIMSQLGRMDLVRQSVHGTTIIYSSPWWSSLMWLSLAIPMCLVAVAFWMQRSWLYRVVSVVVTVMAIVLIATVVPTTFIHRAVLSPDGFEMRIGSWMAPQTYSVRFDQVFSADIQVDPDSSSGSSRSYVLACDLRPLRDRKQVLLPINDFVKYALRSILGELKSRGVILGDPGDGLNVPEELGPWVR